MPIPSDSSRDLHARQLHAEDALAESEARFFQTVELAPVGIGHMALGGTFLRVNRRLADMLGYTADELLGMRFQDLTHPADLVADLDQALRLVAGESSEYRLEKRYVRKDGSIFWASLTVHLVREHSGKPAYFVTIVEDITARREAVDALERRDAEFRSLLANAPDIVARIDAELRHQYVNPAITAATGLLPSDFVGKTHRDLGMPEPLVSEWEGQLRNIFATGEPSEAIFTFPTPNGPRRYWSRNVPEFGPDGRVTSVLGMSRDITERDALLASLREARDVAAWMQQATEMAEVGVWESNLETGEFRASPMALRIHGLPEDATPSAASAFDVIHPDDVAHVRYAVAWAAERAEAYQVEARVVLPDGRIRWVMESGRGLRDEQGRVTRRLVGLSRDITADRAALDRLHHSEARFRDTFEYAPVGLAHVAPDGHWLRMNAGLPEILGYTRAELYALTFQDVTHPDDVAPDMAQVQAMLAGTIDRYSMEKRYIRKDGAIVWANLTVSLVRRSDGAPDYFVSVVEDMSQRHQSEEALRASESRFRTVFEHAATGIAITDLTGRFQQSNRAYERLLGYSGHELHELDAAALVHPDDRAANAREVERLVAGEIAHFDIENRYLHKDGHPVWVHSDLTILPDASGEPAHFMALLTDITARHTQEIALRERESLLSTIFSAIDEGFCLCELVFDDRGRPVDYRFLEVNPLFEQMTGLRGAVGRAAYEMIPALEPEWLSTYARVALDGEPVRFEQKSEAMGRWFDVFATPVEPRGRFAIVFKDVTERRGMLDAERAARERMERLVHALEVERSRLADVFHAAPSFIVAFRGRSLVYDFVNESYYQLVGHREIIGKPLLEAVPELRSQGIDTTLERVFDTGVPWVGRETPVQLQRTPGAPLESRYLDMVFQPLTEADGTRSGVVVHGSDVTAQVLARREVEHLLRGSEQARAEAEAARQEAEAANRGKSEFLAIMSHELRTPLNAIGGYAELIELGIRGPITAEQRSDLGRIQQSQRHLLGLINSLLNYARVEAGAVQYTLSEVSLAEVLTACASLVIPQVISRGLTIVFEPPADAVLARADREKVQQVVLNLLSNAVKFTDAGGRITVTCRDDGRAKDTVSVYVEDTGIGIAEGLLARVFEPFVQVDAKLTRTREGTGLGLAISRDLARGMGGELLVESTLGRGSTFTIVLPRA